MTTSDGQGVGAPLTRKEDDRFLRGRGQYVGDIRLVGMKEVFAEQVLDEPSP